MDRQRLSEALESCLLTAAACFRFGFRCRLSLLQHILGVQVTHQDMEAIDPDYYKNLLQITTLPLEDLGLDLTFSADTETFGGFMYGLLWIEKKKSVYIKIDAWYCGIALSRPARFQFTFHPDVIVSY